MQCLTKEAVLLGLPEVAEQIHSSDLLAQIQKLDLKIKNVRFIVVLNVQ